MNLPENIVTIIIVAVIIGIAREVTSFILKGILSALGIVIVLALIYFYIMDNNEPILMSTLLSHSYNYFIIN